MHPILSSFLALSVAVAAAAQDFHIEIAIVPAMDRLAYQLIEVTPEEATVQHAGDEEPREKFKFDEADAKRIAEAIAEAEPESWEGYYVGNVVDGASMFCTIQQGENSFRFEGHNAQPPSFSLIAEALEQSGAPVLPTWNAPLLMSGRDQDDAFRRLKLQKLSHPDALPNTHAHGDVDDPELVPFIIEDESDLEGIVLDERNAELVGDWQYSTHTPPYFGIGYLHDMKAGKGEKSATFRINIRDPGRYEVRLSHCANPRRATNAKITVHHAGGENEVIVDQQQPGEHERLFHTIGIFEFAAGEDTVTIVISNAGTDPSKVVIVDAVQLIRVP